MRQSSQPREIVPRPGEWQYGNWHFIGTSIAGIRTSIYAREFDVCFDVAQGLPFAISANRFLITHGHMDHAAGIPYLISQKAMNRHKKPVFYMPQSLVEPMHKIIETWAQIEQHTYEYEFVGVKVGQSYELGPDLIFKPFQTIHRVESNGYTLYRKRKTLKPEFKNLERAQLIEKRRNHVELESVFYEPLISFTGDTQIEYLEQNPDVMNSEVLFTEVTYVDERKTVKQARDWGHLHLDELLPLMPKLQNKKICIIHLSSRYQIGEVTRLLDQRVPAPFRDRITIFPSTL